MSIQGEINRVKNNVQNTLQTIADTGVAVGTNSDALPAAAAALANEKAPLVHKHTIADITDFEGGGEAKLTSITLFATAWADVGGVYQQAVTVTDGTANSLVALQLTIDQIRAMQDAGVVALMVDNNNGTFIAKTIGAAPSIDIAIQATVTELNTEGVTFYYWNKYQLIEDEHTLFLFHADSLVDSSEYARGLTNNGVTFTGGGKFGNAISIDGSGHSNVQFSLDHQSTFNSDFTVDFWMKPSSNAVNAAYYEAIVSNAGGTFWAGLKGGKAVVRQYDWGETVTGSAVTADTWVHIAVVRSGSTLYLFQNGVKTGTVTAPTYAASSVLKVGTLTSGNGSFGLLDEVRISNIARWTSNFTPPTAPYVVSGKGEFIEQVSAISENAYPNGGVRYGYYYEKVV